jgi:hypothetical protein
METEFQDIFHHINRIDELGKKMIVSENKTIIIPNKIEQEGKRLYKMYPEFRDLSTFMEHPEFLNFYNKYMNNPIRLKQMLVLMKMYNLIAKYMYENDPLEEKHNAYHKLAILYRIITHPVYSRILFRKPKLISKS